MDGGCGAWVTIVGGRDSQSRVTATAILKWRPLKISRHRRLVNEWCYKRRQSPWRLSALLDCDGQE